MRVRDWLAILAAAGCLALALWLVISGPSCMDRYNADGKRVTVCR